jgi:hypothetical protein
MESLDSISTFKAFIANSDALFRMKPWVTIIRLHAAQTAMAVGLLR